MKPFREQELLSLFKEKANDDQLSTASVGNTATTIRSAAKELQPAITKESSLVEVLEPEEINVTFDPTYLEKMTFGDRDQLMRILDRFREDSSNDLIELEDALTTNQADVAELLVHRLAGRIAQVGAKPLAAEFRSLEYQIREQASLPADVREEVAGVIPKLKKLIELVKNY